MINPGGETEPWDIELSLEYALKEKASISAEYTYHEIERSNLAVGLTALF